MAGVASAEVERPSRRTFSQTTSGVPSCAYTCNVRNRSVERGGKMRRPQFLILAAWLLNGAAWFLPVVTSVGGVKFDPIIGVESFAMSASPLWLSLRVGYDYDTVLAALSAFTTVFFIVFSPWAVLRGTRSLRRTCAWVAAAAFLFNAHWYIRLTPNGWISGLGIGYFLWWLSFAVLATGLFDLAGQKNAAESTQRQAALLPR